MTVKNTYANLTRGATAPFTLTVDTTAELDTWKVTFTLRTEVAQSKEPLITFDNEDSRMTVTGQTVGVVLSSSDTYSIPESCKVVYFQLLLEKDGVVDATWIYSIGVLPNLLPEAEA